MQTIKSCVFTLFFAAAFLLSASAFAAEAEKELKPFYIAKAASPRTLIGIAEKIADLAGQAEAKEFKVVIDAIKNTTGIDHNGFFGLAVIANEDDELIPLFLLPISDINVAAVPGHEDVFNEVRKHLKKAEKEKDTYSLEVPGPMGQPLMTLTVKTQKGFLILVPERFADSVPANAEKMFSELGNDTLVQRINCENIKFEVIEKLLLPIQAMMAIQDPKAAESFGTIIDVYKRMFNEFRSITIGLNFDPKTADIAYSYNIVPRKGTDSEKLFSAFGKETTIFGGFKGSPAENVYFVNTAYKSTVSDKDIELAQKYLDIIFAGAIETIEEESDDEQDSKLAKDAIQSVKNLLVKQCKAEKFDGAASVDVNGILMLAFSLADTKELQNMVKMLYGHFSKKIGEELEVNVPKFVEKNLKKEYVTVEGFKVSRLQIPVMEIVTDFSGEIPKDFKPVISVFWAVKENAAVAFAVGEDAEKTETAFKNALAGTKTAMPVSQPVMNLSIPALGKMLQHVIVRNFEKANPNREDDEHDYILFKESVDVLSKADKDAVVSLSAVGKADVFEAKYFVSGKTVKAVVEVIKTCTGFGRPGLKRDTIEDF